MAGTLLRFASGLRGLRISWLTVGIRLLDPVCPNENDATLPRNPSGKSCARFEIRTRVRLASTCRGFRSPGIMRHSSYSVYRPQCLDPTKRLSPSRVYLPAVRKASTTWSESERNVLGPPPSRQPLQPPNSADSRENAGESFLWRADNCRHGVFRGVAPLLLTYICDGP